MFINLKPQNLFFFLGGQDLEMQCIAKLLAVHAPGRFADAHLAWDAQASSYKANRRADRAAQGNPQSQGHSLHCAKPIGSNFSLPTPTSHPAAESPDSRGPRVWGYG